MTIKKIISLFVLAAFSMHVIAQTTTPTKKAAEKSMKTDVIILKKERKERNAAIAKGHLKTAKKEQAEITTTRKHLNANKKHLKNKGIKTPVKDAKDKVNGTNQ